MATVLIKKIESNIIGILETSTNLFDVSSFIEIKDYYKYSTVEGYLQNYSKVSYSEDLFKVRDFGLNNKNNNCQLIEISY